MNAKDFFFLVAKMRKMQQEFNKTRTSSSHSASVKLEKAVDDEIKRVLGEEKHQTTLFK